MKQILTIITLTLALLASAKPVLANQIAIAGTSATPSFTLVKADTRIEQLKAYFNSHNSPLSDEAAFFVSEADRLNLDWKLVAAIAGTESTFGKRIPANSYNAWGWAIYTGMQDGKHFSSWKDGITTVSEGLKYKYIDKGAITIEQIGRIYAASPRWATNVHFFLNAIDGFAPKAIGDLAVTI
ncbi:MAG: hypothetical protein AAB492_00015 [Patescibacteria group bacterium]